MGQLVSILGASARAAAGSAMRAGWRVHAIDLFADEDLCRLASTERIASFPGDFEAAMARAPDAPWVYTGGLENHPALVERLAQLRPLWGNSSEVLRGVRDPARLARVLTEQGLAYPPVRLAGERFAATANERWLLKPLGGSAGLAVRSADGASEIVPPGHFAQQYVEGTVASAVFVAAKGQAVLVGTSRQLVGRDWNLAPPFLYVGSICPLALAADEYATLARLGGVLAAEFGLVGLFNVDLIRTDDEPWTIEVNPRYSASVEVLERATGANHFTSHITACENGALPAQLGLLKAAKIAGKAVVYARANGVASLALARLISEWNQPGDWQRIADLPATGQPIIAGQPVVTVFAEGSSAEEVERELRSRSGEVLAAIEC